MSKIITLSIDEVSLKQFDDIVEKEFSDRSKMLRKWISEYMKKDRTVVQEE